MTDQNQPTTQPAYGVPPVAEQTAFGHGGYPPAQQQGTDPYHSAQPPAYTFQAAGQEGRPVHLVAAYAPAPPKGLSIASMVLGFASILFGFTFIVPIVGFVLGIIGARKEPAGRGMAVTGIVINGLVLFGWAILAIVLVATGFLGLAAVGAATSSGF